MTDWNVFCHLFSFYNNEPIRRLVPVSVISNVKKFLKTSFKSRDSILRKRDMGHTWQFRLFKPHQ